MVPYRSLNNSAENRSVLSIKKTIVGIWRLKQLSNICTAKEILDVEVRFDDLPDMALLVNALRLLLQFFSKSDRGFFFT